MGSTSLQLTPTPAAPQTPDSTDVALKAAQRTRALSLLALGSGFNGAFKNALPGLGNASPGSAATYGMPSLLGQGQMGDDTGTTAAPNLVDPKIAERTNLNAAWKAGQVGTFDYLQKLGQLS